MHLMIDLETLGTNTDCVVTQLGYCLFELNDEKPIIFADEIHLDPQEQINIGRKVSWKTLQWWNSQSPEARENMFGYGGVKLKVMDALNLFTSNIAAHSKDDIFDPWDSIEGVWSHGLTFDVAIVLSLYNHFGFGAPWKYNCTRDTRTLYALAPDIPMVKATVKHSAMQDAVAQAQMVQKVMRRISNAFEA